MRKFVLLMIATAGILTTAACNTVAGAERSDPAALAFTALEPSPIRLRTPSPKSSGDLKGGIQFEYPAFAWDEGLGHAVRGLSCAQHQ